jgi:uncharacterized protein YjbI with pentapeptide repeats
MTAVTDIDWPTCDLDGCTGVQLDSRVKCLAHAEPEDQGLALEQMVRAAKIDVRGVSISPALLEKILAAARRDAEGRPLLVESQFDAATFESDANFAGATFQGAAQFNWATFKGDASFAGATFRGDAEFRVATFTGNISFNEAVFESGSVFVGITVESYADFNGATFQHDAEFYGAVFQDDARFENTTFHGNAVFDVATIEGDARFGGISVAHDLRFFGASVEDRAWFDGANLQGAARFDEATFQTGVSFDWTTFIRYATFNKAYVHGNARFNEATFNGSAIFDEVAFAGDVIFDRAAFKGDVKFGEVTFSGDAIFPGVTFESDADFGRANFEGDTVFAFAIFRQMADFRGAAFERARDFGPMLVEGTLDLDDSLFAEPARIEVSTAQLRCRRAQFHAGVLFRLRWARVLLDDTDLSAPSLLTGVPPLVAGRLAVQEERIVRVWEHEGAEKIAEQPKLLSLQRANVAGLGLGSVDLAACRFAGAHNLDKLRLEADVAFGVSPARVGWESRQVIAEESAWRASQLRHGPWADPWWPDWTGLEKPTELDSLAVAGLYRSLRKGREDSKDEPGAADFYYGEMEMRRRAGKDVYDSRSDPRGRVDRDVLTAYWLVCGYGLRAWRAVAWLAAVTAVIALAFHLVGFTLPPRPASYWTSLLYSFRSTISLTDNDVKLTPWGQLLQALLRLTGPVLLGLALLALRGRVKR